MDKTVKMDLHTHTKKVKKGEKENRSIPEGKEEEFINSRVQKNVRIVAITNHNVFDEEQYLKLLSNVKKNELIILPGVELDVNLNDVEEQSLNKPFNLILSQSDFKVLNEEIFPKREYDPNKFCVNKEKFFSFISCHSSILLIPTNQKDGNLPKEFEERIKKIELNNKNLVVLGQVSNARAAAIRNNGSDDNNKYNSIAGSDNENWSDFKNNGTDRLNNLPDVPVNINDFESLVKWLKRNQLYGQNISSGYELNFIPSSSENNFWESEIDINLRPGATIIVGSRGSGKSVLLKGIAEELRKKTNLEIESFETSEETETKYNATKKEKKNGLKEKLNSIFRNTIDFQNVLGHIDEARKVSYSNIKLNFDTLKRHLVEKRKNSYKTEFSILGSLMINNIAKYSYVEDEDEGLKTKLENSFEDIKKINEVLKMIQVYEQDKSFVYSEFSSLTANLSILINSISTYILNSYLNVKLKKMIYVSKLSLSASYSKKTNTTSAPKTKPLYQLWKKRIDFRFLVTKFLSTESMTETIKLGIIYNNRNKKEELFIDGRIFVFSEENSKLYKKDNYEVECEKKSAAKKLISKLTEANNLFLAQDFSEKTKELKTISGDFTGNGAYDFIGFAWKVCTKNGKLREPSSGEKQTMMLNNYLDQDKEFYLLDEPEKSLDNKFVYEAINQKIMDLISQNKYVIFTTHNANLAVLTDPDLVIYRKIQDDSKYPISLIGPDENNQLKDNHGEIVENWKEIAELILEGGSDAFRERGNYYGRKTSK